jgi:hypothetical protein
MKSGASAVASSNPIRLNLEDVNATLHTMTYTSGQHQCGVDTIVMVLTLENDAEMSSAGMIDVTVQCMNDAPVVTLPATLALGATTLEDVPLLLAGIVVVDVDARDMLTVTATAEHGVVAWKWPSPGLRKWNDTTMESGVTHMNRALQRVSYTPALDRVGVDTVTVVVTDQEGTTTTARFHIDVQSVNDPPTITGPLGCGGGTYHRSRVEDTASPVVGLSVADNDGSPHVGNATVTVRARYGTFTVAMGGAMGGTTGTTGTMGTMKTTDACAHVLSLAEPAHLDPSPAPTAAKLWRPASSSFLSIRGLLGEVNNCLTTLS